MTENQTDPIFDADGEVIRPLSRHKRWLRKDFEWLNERGHWLLAKQFKRQSQTGNKMPQPDLRAKSILMRAAYVFSVQLAEREKTDLLEEYLTGTVEQDLRMHSGAPSAEENPFFWTLHLLMSKAGWLTRDQKSKTSRALCYAYRHGVPPEFLIGFILQVGYEEACRCLANDKIEHWFDGEADHSWIKRL